MLKHSPEILMQIAELYAQESRATRAKVGAVLVTSTGVLIPGYNGTPQDGTMYVKSRIKPCPMSCMQR